MSVSRSSTRQVKRKKFDDEVVECSVKKDKYKKVNSNLNSNKIIPTSMSEDANIISATTLPIQTATDIDKDILFSEESNETIEHNEIIGQNIVEPEMIELETIKQDTDIHLPETPLPFLHDVIYHDTAKQDQTNVDHNENYESTNESNILTEPVDKSNILKLKISTKSNRIKSFKESIDSFLQESWLPDDDLNLILSVQQTCDLNVVHLCTNFSRPYTLDKITKRWNQLLYDEEVSRSIMQGIKNLHVDNVSFIESKLPFSKNEEQVISSISSTTQVTQDMFEELLVANSTTFNSNRTSKSLYKYWSLLKLNYLLPDQTVQPIQKSDHILIFSDAEDQLNDEVIRQCEDDAELEKELMLADRRNKREIRQLEQEITLWQAVVESMPGVSHSEFDNLTLATLRGRHVKYYMRSNKISFGRGCKDNQVDVDLTLAGPAFKISRQQGWIIYQPPDKLIGQFQSGQFVLTNDGRCPMYINGNAVLKGQRSILFDNSVIEISCIKLIFYINKELLNYMRTVNES